jgi:guanyl-specific ribonuclease Sa
VGSSRRITVALVGLVVLVLAGWFVQDRLSDEPAGGMPEQALSALPAEVADTWRLIERNGPFPHEEDGAVFENREGRLPDEDPGYYREYTVETRGSTDRGARRLVTGAEREVYYTADHYGSFVRVDVTR